MCWRWKLDSDWYSFYLDKKFSALSYECNVTKILNIFVRKNVFVVIFASLIAKLSFYNERLSITTECEQMAGAFLLFLRLIRRRIYDESTLVWSMNSFDGNKHITNDDIDGIVQFTCVWPVNKCVFVWFYL